MKIIHFLFFFCACTFGAVAQTSDVVFSNLNVLPQVDATANAMNTFRLEFTVSDPSRLKAIEILLDDVRRPANNTTQVFAVYVTDGVVKINIEGKMLPVEGTTIYLYVKVKDQFTSPYSHLRVRGVDQEGNGSNELAHKL